MAKAKPAGTAAKKSSKSKSGSGKRKRKGGSVEDRPIIVKGHALPTEGDDPEPSAVFEAQVPANFTFLPGQVYPFQYNYSDTVQPAIVTIEVFVDGERVLEQKVEDTSWQIFLHTV